MMAPLIYETKGGAIEAAALGLSCAINSSRMNASLDLLQPTSCARRNFCLDPPANCERNKFQSQQQ